MTHQQMAVAEALLKGRVGLGSDRTVRARLSRCLDDGASRLHLSLDDYLARIAVDDEAFQELLDRVTVQHSYFFRDPNQFLALVELLAAAPRGPGTIWSAASANGQEAYSLAILLDECGRADWRVLATDVSEPALGRARAARYSKTEVRGISPARLRQNFARSGDGWEVVPRLRERVDIRRHNLSAARPPLPGATFSIIFCRNVLIYFDKPGVEACIGRLVAYLPPGGHLFLGFSETLETGSNGLELVRIGDAFVYRRRPAGAKPAAKRAMVRTTPRPAPVGRVPRPAPVQFHAEPLVQSHAEPLRLLADGERAFAAGDQASAIIAFRKAIYLEPDEPVGYFQLGTVLERSGDRREARRAFAAAGAALARTDTKATPAGLEGYSSAELGRAIAAKLGSL
jgi:chemotaxis methyl-accepting protein methylase